MRLTRRGRVVSGLAVGAVLVAAVRVSGGHARTPAPAARHEAASVAVTPPAHPTPSRTASPTTAPTTAPAGRGTGQLRTVPGTTAVGGHGPLRTYRVQVEDGLGEDSAAFAAAVQTTLTDPRSWGRDLSFQRVATGAVDFTVVLAAPETTQRLCRPLDVQRRLSCFQHGRSVVNDMRWRRGADAYDDDLAAYRRYVVNHEVGHALGHHHEQCPGAGRLAPVMMQQTKGIGACRPNPWPFP